MKKKSKFIILTIILFLCISGGGICFFGSANITGDAANTNEVSTDVPVAVPTQEPTTKPEDIDDNSQEMTLKLELMETDDPQIMDILFVSGIYTDSVNNIASYSYKIPQFNADSESAKMVNQRIVDDIYPLVEGEFELMSMGGSLINCAITYEVMKYGDIVAILVSVPYDNDVMNYYAYSYDFKNDKELRNQDLLGFRGMSEEDFVEKACEMELAYFKEISEGLSEEIKEGYKDIIEEAKAVTTIDLPMYLDEEGILNVYIPFPSLAGASWYYYLCEF
ncbi:MAG: hypothetical protein IJW63_03495 [Lachnospiraceae bacterium]|nr:hypothetical protein [Lachnospiraceae bacterium]